MKDMALKGFHMLKKNAQFLCLDCRNDPEGIFNSPDACKGMSDGADTADPSADPGRIVPLLADKHCLKETGGLNNLPASLLKLSGLDCNPDIAMPFYPCKVMNIYIAINFHLFLTFKLSSLQADLRLFIFTMVIFSVIPEHKKKNLQSIQGGQVLYLLKNHVPS